MASGYDRDFLRLAERAVAALERVADALETRTCAVCGNRADDPTYAPFESVCFPCAEGRRLVEEDRRGSA